MPLHYTLRPSDETVARYLENDKRDGFESMPCPNLTLLKVDESIVIASVRDRAQMVFYDLPFQYENKNPWKGFLKFEREKSFGIGIGSDFSWGQTGLFPALVFFSDLTGELSEQLGVTIKVIAAVNIPYGYGFCDLSQEEPMVVFGIGGCSDGERGVPLQAFYYMLVNYFHLMSHVWQSRVFLTGEGKDAMVHQACVGASMAASCGNSWHYLNDFFHYEFESEAEYSGIMNANMVFCLLMEQNPGVYHDDHNLEYMSFRSDMPGYFFEHKAYEDAFKAAGDGIRIETRLFSDANAAAQKAKPLWYGQWNNLAWNSHDDLLVRCFSDKHDVLHAGMEDAWEGLGKIDCNGGYLGVVATIMASRHACQGIMIPSFQHFLRMDRPE